MASFLAQTIEFGDLLETLHDIQMIEGHVDQITMFEKQYNKRPFLLN